MTNFYSPYAIILYDNLKNNAERISQRLNDFIRFKTHGQIDIQVFETKNISQFLTELADKGYSWVTVATPGNYLQSQELFLQSIEHAKSQDAPLACHILDKGGYYHFHPQWFSIDLQVYKKIGCPSLEEKPGRKTFLTKETERCADNAHDNYTPWWVRPLSANKKEYTTDYGYFGIDLISALVDHGYAITNIPQEIRNKKNFCYPDHNAEIIERLMNGSEEEIKDQALWWFMKNITHLRDNLHRGYYVLNTEPLIKENHSLLQNKNFDCFMGVCGGLKPACITGSDQWDENSKIYLFDISSAAIKWQQYLLDNWDGDLGKFEQIFRTFESNNQDLKAQYFGDKSIDTNIQWFLDSANLDRELFYQRWQKYRKQNHEFLLLNMLDETFLQVVQIKLETRKQNAYFWASNVFYMDYLMFFKGRAWSRQRTIDFIEGLRSILKDGSVLELENTLHSMY